MAIHYLERRGRIHFLPSNIMADVMRHFHARQHLGKAIIVGEDPELLVSLAHRQWLKLSRVLQRRRGMASNAVSILKYTYTITQMQHMMFSTRLPQDDPEASVYILRPSQLAMVPANCFSIYLTTELSERLMARLIGELPASGLVVDYGSHLEPGDFGLLAREELETRVGEAWRAMETFLNQHGIGIGQLVRSTDQTEALDDALDALLNVEVDFLAAAGVFQRMLDLARPLRTTSSLRRREYEVVLTLAHRVQTLAPGAFSPKFLNTYADDTFFLNDRRRRSSVLAALIARHQEAGRFNIVRALLKAGAMGLPEGGKVVRNMELTTV